MNRKTQKKIQGLILSFFALVSFSACQSTLKTKDTPNKNVYAHENSVKVAFVQFPIKASLKRDEFFKKMSSYIQQAAQKKANVVFFPEYVSLDLWPLGSKEKDIVILKKITQELDKAYLDFLKNEALKHKIWIIGGSFPRLSNGKIYNSAPIFSPNGDLVLQDKIFLTHWEREMNMASGESLQLVKGPWGLGVVLICYDVEFPQISQHLSSLTQDLNLIFVPSMTESASGLQRVLKTAAARSVEHHSYTVVSATVGNVSADWQHFGESTAFSPEDKGYKGTLLKAAKNKAGIQFIDLNFTKLVQGKKESRYYPAKDQSTYPIKIKNI